jgi:hypothetical protein
MATESITEPIVSPIGIAGASTPLYTNTSNIYDIAIGGQPFLLGASDKYPYQRQTATYRKQQFDNTKEVGEQSFEGWWLRSQSSFHNGAGINYLDPYVSENVQYRFFDSEGVDVWTPGQATLLKNVSTAHTTTGAIRSNGRPWQYSRSIEWTQNGNNYDGILMHDEYDVDKIFPTITVSINNKALTSNVATLQTTAAHGLAVGMEITITDVDATFNGTYTITGVPTTTTFTYAKTATNVTSTAVSPVGTGTTDVIHFIDYNAGSDDPVFAICDDGTTAFWVTNDTTSGKIEVNKKALTGTATTSPTVMFTQPGITVTNAVIEFVKERLVMAANNKIYEFATSATALPTELYTHPSTAHVYTSITASGNAIYVAGYNGIQSTIQKFTLNSSGVMPTLTFASVAAELPVGEIAHKIYYYLGYMLIGTSQGIRVATVADDGAITYGPIVVHTEQPTYDFAARDNFVWAATNVNGKPGVTRIDLSQEIEPLRFAYANDLYYNEDQNRYTTSCAFLSDTNRLAFTTSNNGSNGTVYIEDANTLTETGFITTGFIRYATIEKKYFKLIKPRFNTPMFGTCVISTKEVDGDINSIITIAGSTPAINTDLATNISSPQEELAFKFTLGRDTSDTTKGPEFDGYQVKSLPAVVRARQLTIPLVNYDFETDRYGIQNGYETRAWDRLQALESLEAAGDTVIIQDFTTGEQITGLIEQLSFERTTPSDRRYTGFGGIVYVSIRTV